MSTINSIQPQSRGRTFYSTSVTVLVISWLALATDVFLRYNIPTAIPFLKQEYGWSSVTVGWVDSAYIWAYALAQVPWGYASERWLGGRLTLMLGTGIMVISSLLFAFNVGDVTSGIIARAGIGIGAASVTGATNAVLARWFAPRVRGLQMGLLGTGGSLGGGVGGAAMPYLLTSGVMLFGLSGMQSGFLLSAIPGVALIVVVALFFRNQPEEIGLASLDHQVDERSPVAARSNEPGFVEIMLRSPYPYLLAGTYTGFVATKYFVWTWFSVFLSQRYGMDQHSAGFIFGVVFAVPPILMLPMGGWLSDRFGRVRTTVTALIATTVLAGILGYASTTAAMPLWIVITTASLFSVSAYLWVMVWPLTTIMFPTSAGAPIAGFMNGTAQLVGAAAPILSGYLIDLTGSFAPAFIAGAVCAAFGTVCAVCLKEHRVV